MSSELHGVVLGMGNPLLDISAPVGQEMFEKYGLKAGNAILAEPKHLPLYDELAAIESVEYIAGGATLNTIRICQWILDQAGATSYIGCIGKDKFGETMQDRVTQDGVNGRFLIDEETPTGTCAVLIKDKERSLCANLAAANNYKKEHLEQKEQLDIIDTAKIIYIAGFFLTVSPPAIMAVAEKCLQQNKVFCMNLSAPFIPQFFGEPLAAALEYVDFIFGNETEAKAYAEANNLEDTSAEAVAKHLAVFPSKRKSNRTVVITQGSKCTVVVNKREGGIVSQRVSFDNDGCQMNPSQSEDDLSVQSFDVPKLEKDKIVDLNGAGDCFVGGFLARLAEGKSIEECVTTGHSAARYIIQQSGIKFEGKADFE